MEVFDDDLLEVLISSLPHTLDEEARKQCKQSFAEKMAKRRKMGTGLGVA